MLCESDPSRNAALFPWQRWMLCDSDASRISALLTWQRWMFCESDASRNPALFTWQRLMLCESDASRKPASLTWQRWMLCESDACVGGWLGRGCPEKHSRTQGPLQAPFPKNKGPQYEPANRRLPVDRPQNHQKGSSGRSPNE